MGNGAKNGNMQCGPKYSTNAEKTSLFSGFLADA